MISKRLWTCLLTGGLSTLMSMTWPLAQAAEPPAAWGTADVRQLMSDQEWTRFRAQMWAAKTDDERNRLRVEHHEEMKKRAQAKGMSIPDQPPPMGMGPGMGAGPRMQPPCAASAAPCGPRHPMKRHKGGMGGKGGMPASAPKP